MEEQKKLEDKSTDIKYFNTEPTEPINKPIIIVNSQDQFLYHKRKKERPKNNRKKIKRKKSKNGR